MKILCPVDGPDEAARLAALGARELYGGVLSPRWSGSFGLAASANRRSFPEAQIADMEALRAAVDAAHAGDASFFLTVNSPFYTRDQFGPLLDILERAVEAGVDAFIAADIGLIIEARERWPSIPVHLSTMAEVTNSGAASFYRRLGVGRITLPRHLSLSEIEGIVSGSEGMKFDVFILYGQCANAEGICTFSHDHPRRLWPCVQPYRIASRSAGTSLREGRAPALCAQQLWDGLARGEACGLCGLRDLHRLGVEAVKIVGRGTATARKEWAVATTARLIAMIEEGGNAGKGGDGRDEFRAEARRLYRERFPKGCRSTLCYFPELLGDDNG
jgi:putative protease